MNSRTVAIFGVFDGIHEGHRHFIHEARGEGDRLVAIVARDSVVEKLKGSRPLHDEATRIESLLDVPEVDMAYLGDGDEGTYYVIKEVKPNIIYLGYDQEALSDSINKAIKKKILPKMEIKFGKPYKPKNFKSSIINKINN
ncbi:MAG: adenylyltransferase/cytidyltransferase family protein [Patescibacteria group bacterium]